MERLSALFKALSDRNRLRIMMALTRHQELCACQITELIQVTGATASRHMGILISSGLVDSRKEGRWVYYRLCRHNQGLDFFIQWIETQLQEDRNAAADAASLERILAEVTNQLC